MTRRWIAISLALVALVIAGRARAETVAELDARLERELAAVSPEAVAPFHEANAARLAGDHARARELFGEVMRLAPSFIAATRRACEAEFELKHRDEALVLCRRAVEREDSALDDVTLAIVLVTPPAAPGDIAEARVLSRRAMDHAGDDADVVASACEVAEDAHDVDLIQAAADTFDDATRDPRELVCKAIAAATRAEFDDAEDLARRAEEAGAPADVAAHLGEAIRAARPVDARVLIAVLRIAASVDAVLVGLALLALGVGAIVARGARRSRPISGLLGVVSRLTLWSFAAASVLAIPALVATALVVVGVSLQRWLTPGGVSPALGAASAAAVVVTIGARKLLGRSDDPPGSRLARDSEPRLVAAIDDATARVGAPRVDAIYLVPGVTVRAFERSALVERILSAGERALVIGAGGLGGLTVNDLVALVGAETARLAGGGAGGAFARAVRRAFGDRRSLRRSWWFFRALAAVFAAASRGAIAADRQVADARAKDAFGDQPERAARRLAELAETHRAAVEEVLERFATRGEALENVYAEVSPPNADVNGSAWELFADRDALERSMTAELLAER